MNNCLETEQTRGLSFWTGRMLTCLGNLRQLTICYC